jgi:hypothetical protein
LYSRFVNRKRAASETSERACCFPFLKLTQYWHIIIFSKRAGKTTAKQLTGHPARRRQWIE